MIKRVVSYVCAAAAGIICAFILSGVFMISQADGSGMEPELRSGSRVLINKLAYSFNGNVPQTGDVIAFKSDVYGEEGEGRILIRRVAAGPGDCVEIRDSIFYLNDKPYTDYMSDAAYMEPFSRKALGDDEIFVLSDNRKSSMDSRNEAIGILETSDCIGKVCFW